MPAGRWSDGTTIKTVRRLAVLVASASTVAFAQPPVELGTVAGTVRDASGRGLAGARIGIVGGRLAGESDDSGEFRIRDVVAGETRLTARRIGFAPETVVVAVRPMDLTLVTLALRRVSIPIPPVIVNGRRDIRGPMAGFYARLERGQGRFFTQEQLEQQVARRMSDLLRGIPGLRIEQRRSGAQQVRSRGSATAPLFWLDGVPMQMAELDLDNFDPRGFAGIEIYSGPATVPVEFTGSRAQTSSGGAILLWTRQGEPSKRPRKRGELSPAAMLAQLIEQSQVYTADGVDSPVMAIGGSRAVPIYPDSLYGARQSGHVEVEFVVDATGTPRMDTFGVVATTHHSLTEAVRRVLEDRRFVPATRRGVAVAQLVQQPFEFVVEPPEGARKPEN